MRLFEVAAILILAICVAGFIYCLSKEAYISATSIAISAISVVCSLAINREGLNMRAGS